NGIGDHEEGTAYDQYKLDPSDMKTFEKKISSQTEMELLRSRPSENGEVRMKVPISEHWQGKQKLDNKIIVELGEILKQVSENYSNSLLQMDYIVKGSELYITTLEELVVEHSETLE